MIEEIPGFRMRIRTILDGNVEYLKAFVPPPNAPRESLVGHELGRIVKRIAESDRSIFDRWVDVMESALMLIITDVEGIDSVQMYRRSPGAPL